MRCDAHQPDDITLECRNDDKHRSARWAGREWWRGGASRRRDERLAESTPAGSIGSIPYALHSWQRHQEKRGQTGLFAAIENFLRCNGTDTFWYSPKRNRRCIWLGRP